MTTNLDKVKERIRHLSNRTVENGCTEAEALVAMGKVSALLADYNLNMSEVEVREERCISESIDARLERGDPMHYVVMSIATFCDAKVWRNSTWINGRTKHSYVFFGHEADVSMARYLYQVIESAILHETCEFKHSETYRYATQSKKGMTKSFEAGMTSRISKRLQEMKRTADAANHIATGRALVVVKNAVVSEEWAKLNLRLRKTTSNRQITNPDAFNQGHAAGDKVNLSRPINSGNTSECKRIA